MKHFLVVISLFLLTSQGFAQQQPDRNQQKLNVSGVIPDVAMVAGHSPRTEAGIGALMPWADRLWAVTYVAHMKRTGSGTGLYEIDQNLDLHKHPKSVVGTYANRLIHGPSHQLLIGPYAVDTLGNVRLIDGVKEHRLAATMEHLDDPENKVYYLAMEGEFFEVDVHTLETRLLFDLKEELKVPGGAKPHFKSGFTNHGRVVIANNTYNSLDDPDGRLAEWDGKGDWQILEKTAFTEVWSARASGSPMIATGWDKASVILKAFINGQWKTYRLPKGSRTFDETSYTEWMRIRSVETERALMDVHGLFYEVAYHTYADGLWGIRPISTHLRIIPDFASWRGMLVLAGNQATPMKFGTLDRNPLAGQSQAGLWFGKTDDLWSFGKAKGEGGVWYETEVKAGEPSDPYLMGGFDDKSVHFYHNSDEPVQFTLEVDVVGDGRWHEYKNIQVPADQYIHYEFPDSYSARWIRVIADKDCSGTAYFIYE
ncbi:MAG: hypothetical protein R3281_14645 [Balneolaceae bacterium]|nr:hypothetical protein [Balneolaceae bacterium]